MALAQQTPGPAANIGEYLVGSATFGALVGHWIGYLPGIMTAIGGCVGIIYYCLQVWRDEAVQSMIRAWRQRRIDKYKAKIIKLEQAVVVSKVTKDAGQ
jgi:hypothetical protein